MIRADNEEQREAQSCALGCLFCSCSNGDPLEELVSHVVPHTDEIKSRSLQRQQKRKISFFSLGDFYK